MSARLGVVLAGGGTGGHIHPNLAVLEALRSRLGDDVLAHCIVSDRAIDARVLEGAPELGPPTWTPSPAAPLLLRPRGLVRFVTRWGAAVRAARRVIGEVRSEADRVVMLATGGFVAAPSIVGARAEGIERVVVNLDAVPGKANRLASRFATRTLSVGRDLPPIVRSRMRQLPAPADARAELGLDPGAPVLLITGGSQGAASVNRFALACARQDRAALDGWQVLHQAGVDGADESAAGWRAIGVAARVEPYLDRMDLALASAEAVVCRGGAGAVADLWAAQRPAIILPYPYHADEHQRRNAEPLERAGGVVICRDLVDPTRNAEAHRSAWQKLLDGQERVSMREGYARLGPAAGADRLADLLIEAAGL